jgi:threonine/homoserine efflux transporter RhtA
VGIAVAVEFAVEIVAGVVALRPVADAVDFTVDVEIVVGVVERVVNGMDLVDVVELAGAVVAAVGTVIFVELGSGGNTRYPSTKAVGSSIRKLT